jgi:hypothetical protein
LNASDAKDWERPAHPRQFALRLDDALVRIRQHGQASDKCDQ